MSVLNARLALLVGFIVFVPLLNGIAQTPAAPKYLDPSQSINVRVDDLVGRMTLEEKASQLVNQSRAIPRLQVPAYDWWSEALHGVANAGLATVFPEPIGLAATFDPNLIHDMAVVIGTEARAKHNQAVRAGRRDIMEGLDFWSPNINIFRDPRWGRGQETYGEDPFLTAKMGVAFVTGLQGDDPKYFRVISTPKHFAVHSGPEPTRHGMNVLVSKHDMEDTYLPAFRATVTDGKAGSVMCAYNRVNGQPACANTFLLEDQLRRAWNFEGYVVSDCGAVVDISEGHHYARNKVEAAALSLKTGMDNECIDFLEEVKDSSDYGKYVEAVKQGLLSENDIDVALKRLFTARMKLGMFDPPSMVPYAQIPDSVIDSPPHRELALKIARESMVLLKNDGVLPLTDKVTKILVSGPMADAHEVLYGNYNGYPSHTTSALDGIRRQFPTAKVSYVPGTNFLRERSTVPTSALSEDGKPGLKAEYFPTADFSGSPLVTRVERHLFLNLGGVPDPEALGPPPGIKDFSVRWTGFLTPNESGEYQIAVDGWHRRLWLDGKLLFDDTKQDLGHDYVTVSLTKGHRYALKVESVKSQFGVRLSWFRLIDQPLVEAAAAARDADVIVAVVGITSALEGEEMKVDSPGFHGGDRTSLNLPEEEDALLGALKSTGKPLIVVLMNGSALAVNWAREHANAILEAWYSGEEGGSAIAQTLAGINNPAGRLPVTFYKGTEQLPDFEDYSMRNRTYRYFEGEPLYRFGFGLSYSKFEYINIVLSTHELNAGDPLGVEVDVKNSSSREGDEVVELYLTFAKVPGAPLRALRGVDRVHLGAGEQRRVKFKLDARDLSYVNEGGDRLVGAGEYMVSVGGGQPGTDAAQVSAPLSIRGERKLPE